ncbi:MAG: S41 family peptidase [Bacteroidia bacterium]|nr:S41 family peptidase [Bacteroidia bacterium]
MQKHLFKFSLIALLTIIPLFYFFYDDNNLFEITKNLEIFNSVYKNIHESYIEKPKSGELIKTAIDAMLNSLDPYTNYISEDDIEEYRFQTTGVYAGIGGALDKINDKIFITEVYEDSPALQSGLVPGSEIISVNGKDISKLSINEISNLIKGEAGTSVQIKFIPFRSNTPIEKNIVRKEIKTNNNVFYTIIKNNIGYIRLRSFTEKCAEEVKKSVIELKKQNVQGILLDVRDNPGGLLMEAIQLVNIFIPKDVEVVYTKGRTSNWYKSYKTMENPIDVNIPLVVLINENSASASEIVAGALQDLDRAVVIGSRSYGKGLVQNTIDLPYNTKLKITIAKYYTPSGRCIQALDYTQKDKSGRVLSVPDSLITAFKTKNGRIVYDGAGITPDIKTVPENLSAILIDLNQQNFFFLYAYQYALQNKQIPSPKEFSLTEKDIQEFFKLLKEKKYVYHSDQESILKQFKTSAENDSIYNEIKKEYEELLNGLSQIQEKLLQKNIRIIKEFLEINIINFYYFSKGKEEYIINKDNEIEQSTLLLSDKNKIKEILTKTEPPKKPFNSEKKF